MAFSKTIWNDGVGISVTQGSEYILNGYVYVNNDPVNNSLLTRLVYKPLNYSLAELDTYQQFTPTDTFDAWKSLTTTFTAKATETIKIGLYQEYTNEGTNTTGNCDLVTFKGPLDTLTEKKTIIYDSGCLYNNFPVKWLNSLGGYDYYNFQTYGDRGIQFGQSRTIKRNIFANFPSDFKNAQVQTDYVGVESKDTIALRAENLTEQQREDMEELLRSVRVYDNRDPNKPKVLIVDKSSISYTQGEKLYNLTFNATSTFDNYRQRQ